MKGEEKGGKEEEEEDEGEEEEREEEEREEEGRDARRRHGRSIVCALLALKFDDSDARKLVRLRAARE